MSVRLIAALCVAAVALDGCAFVQRKTLGQSLDEASAATQIKTKLLANGGPAHFGEVDVEVEGRFVLLSGRVPSEDDRRAAERIAWSVKLVDEVANELVIERRNFGRDVNDIWIGQQVRARLLVAHDVKSLNYNVQVYDGTVYLLGLAGSQEEMQHAAEQASLVRGVQKVVSYVKVRARARPSYLDEAPPPADAREPTGAPIQIAPAVESPAPIVAAQPTGRPNDSDSSAPAPRSANHSLTSQPLPPVH